GKVVEFNPFESSDVWADAQRRNFFIDALKKMYKEEQSWGHRLEEILIYSVNACYEGLPGFNVVQLARFIRDTSFRNEVLRRVVSEPIRVFWTESFPRFQDWWISSVETKLTHFEDPMVAPFFSYPHSSFDLRKVMDEGKMIIFHLPEGVVSAEVANFIGSLFLGWVCAAGLSREDIPEEQRRPFYVYVDEAARFVTQSLRDLLQALRKYHVYVTVCVQDLEAFPKDIARDIPQLCTTKISFSEGAETAQALEPYFQPQHTAKSMINLPRHTFAVCTLYGGVYVKQTMIGIDPGPPPFDYRDTIRESLERWGMNVEVSSFFRRKGMEDEIKAEIPVPELTPIQYLTLATVAKQAPEESDSLQRGEVRTEKLVELLKDHYGYARSHALTAVRNLTVRGYLHVRKATMDSSGRRLAEPREYVSLTKTGWAALYPPLEGPRAGGGIHVELLGRAIRWAWQGGMCPVVSKERGETTIILPTGATVDVERMPDLVVYPPATEMGGISENFWDPSRRFAVEVEVHPTHHPDRVLGHFELMRRVGMPVIFVCREEDREYLRDLLAKVGTEGDVLAQPQPGVFQVMTLPPELGDAEQEAWLEEYCRAFDAEYAKQRRLGKMVEEIKRGKTPPGKEEEKPEAVLGEPKFVGGRCSVPFECRGLLKEVRAFLDGREVQVRLGEDGGEIEVGALGTGTHILVLRLVGRDGRTWDFSRSLSPPEAVKGTPELEEEVPEKPEEEVPEERVEAPQKVEEGPEKTEVLRPKRGGARKGAGRKSRKTDIRGRIRKVMREGYQYLGVKKIAGRKYVYARQRDAEGRTKDISLGPYEVVKEILEAYKIKI
ncbi:MAG: hypothetical protein QXR87_07945, partial [Candidatus Hadarchaeales archaeon]